MYDKEFKNDWDIDVFTKLAKASLHAGGWISYKDFYEKEQPCNGIMYFGMAIDSLVGLKYVKRLGTRCNLTETGLKRYNAILGA